MKKVLQRKHSDIMQELHNPQKHPELALVDWDKVEKSVGPDQSQLWLKINSHGHASNLECGDVDEKMQGDCGLEMRHLLGQYLMKLQSSYSNQLQMGLLTPIAYSSILRALKTAVDHCNDHRLHADGCVDAVEGRRKWRDVSSMGTTRYLQELLEKRNMKDKISVDDLQFEWGWLQVSG